MVGGNSRVEIFAHHVEKYTSNPASTARKYAAVHQIAASNGFLAPRVIEIRTDRILLERMHAMRSLGAIYLNGTRREMEAAVGRAGEVLALLHNGLQESGAVTWSPPSGFAEALQRFLGRRVDIEDLPHASLHGDYSFANVWVSCAPAQSIIIIDPCPNFCSTFDDWTVGPAYLDIGKMLSCLEGQISAYRQHRRPSPARVNELQQKFLEGYGSLGRPSDSEMAHAFAFAVSSAQFYRRFGRLSALHRFALYNRFRGNFPSWRKLQTSVGNGNG
jgi:hypothetical protein